MEEYENQVAKYLRKVGNYARYCVTLDFRGNELIPRRIQMRLVLTMIFIAI
ncbi:TPA: DNA/RNA non-specific endonuclease, partial [Enterococcus faecium]